jgi:hypothetical protein
VAADGVTVAVNVIALPNCIGFEELAREILLGVDAKTTLEAASRKKGANRNDFIRLLLILFLIKIVHKSGLGKQI